MKQNTNTYQYTRAVCLNTARSFEREAAKALMDAQFYADLGDPKTVQRYEAAAKLAQQRANAWRIRAKTAPK